ncbi:putative chlorophyll synthesis pathway protein BchC [Dictyocaulus viviparus]|uniref:Sorbitol dehydrogenase n=1 Tax=Dictyocaulus viviparus TaxID=29172 RepID=A0A0D8YC46_DICVI|nr:putative chlorophyll synthesis pathway protein BchC [Dictyocaulus viviparus]
MIMMSGDNLSAVLFGVKDIRVVQREIPKPNSNQLLISVHTVGICGSDVHYWTHGSIGKYVVKEPMVLGHETSGTVVGMGCDVSGFKVGDRVALEPGIPCRCCDQCKNGRYNLCSAMKFFATPPVHGSLTRYVVLDADFCYKLPENVSFEEGALMEPLSVAVHACKRANIQIGHRVLVEGAGTIGTLCMMAAKAAGASEIVLTDICRSRLEMAKKLGADHTIYVKGMSASDIRSNVIDHLETEPDVTIECTGVHTCIEAAILTTRSGGVIVLVGVGDSRADLPIIESALREVDIRGVFRYANCYPTALNLISSGQVDLSGITRAHYKLENTVEAFQRVLKADVIKVFIDCQK